MRFEGVIPLRQRVMALQAKRSNLIPCRFETAGIVSSIEIGGDLKSGLGLGGTGVVEDLLVGIQGFAGPVARDCRKEAMLDGIPFGSTGGIVGYGDGESKRVNQVRLQFSFPGVAAATVAAAGIGEDEKLA